MSDKRAEQTTVPDTLETEMFNLKEPGALIHQPGKSLTDVEKFFEAEKIFDENPSSDGFLTPKTGERSFKSTKSTDESKLSGLTTIIQEMFGQRKELVIPKRQTEATYIMNKRYGLYLNSSIPEIDMLDIGMNRQTEPEYSQSMYAEMLIEELVIGDYLNERNMRILGITSHHRSKAIMLIHHLTEGLALNPDALHVSASIMDKFLINMAALNKKAPCLVTLSVTCVILSNKLDNSEPVRFSEVSRFLDKHYGIKIFRKSFRKLELDVLIALDFTVSYVSPLAFLDRYSRIFDIDRIAGDREAEQIGTEARKICFLTLEHSQFLNFRPCQIAAASLMIAMKMVSHTNLIKEKS